MTQNSSLPPRRSALHMLDRITGEGALLSEVLSAGALDRLPPEGRARAQRLTTETLRQMSRADALLARFVKKIPAGTVGNILRIATVELCSGGAAHGVVHDWVEICARGKHTVGLKGLVNAVLRKVSGAQDVWESLPPARLPHWLREPLVDAWGGRAVSAMEAAHAAGAPLDLTLKGEPTQTLPGEPLPTGSWRIKQAGQVTTLPGFSEGDWWVQDAAAALPARILAPRKGEAVADLCAAPGGKSLQLAAMGAEVTAIDVSGRRLERLRENLTRCNLRAEVREGDVLALESLPGAVLLDAPCSATGTIRRHPDLPFAKDGSEFGALIELQTQMLEHVIALMPSGGRLVYCTCSLLPDEGEVQIDYALSQHDDIEIDRAALDLPGVDPAWITPEGGLRLRPDYWPERGGMDGFYIASLRKR